MNTAVSTLSPRIKMWYFTLSFVLNKEQASSQTQITPCECGFVNKVLWQYYVSVCQDLQ